MPAYTTPGSAAILSSVGLYNLLRVGVQCPRCGKHSEVEAQTKVGFLNLYEYRLGDHLRYDDAPAGFRRVEDAEAEGYAECPACGKDFWLDVEVRSGQIVGAVADDRPGYIP